MFKKVLIAEDEELLNISLRVALKELSVKLGNRDFVSYCDDALMRIRKAIGEGDPYELLITDLSFKEDSRRQEIASGAELIRAVKEIQPSINVLVFSVDAQKSTANSLFNELGIDGYVPKGRGAATDFRLAINAIYQGKKYHSPRLGRLEDENRYAFSAMEKQILTMIAQGRTQKEISTYLKANQIRPWSLSSIEKTLSHLKIALNVSTPAQLVCYCRDREII